MRGFQASVTILISLSALLSNDPVFIGASDRPESVTTEITGKDGVAMALVPTGEFLMGSNDGASDERPVHRLYLDAFYIDKFEVTTSRYAKFLQATNRKPPDKWSEVNPTFDWARPVIGVDWSEADAYCQWAGKRLPTESEWEKAARGTDGRKYPWGGEDASESFANFDWDSRRTWRGYSTLTPVGSYESGRSPYWVYDAAGNVWEWVSDWYSPNTYQNHHDRNPKGPTSGIFKVTRGGSWGDKPYSLRTTNRRGIPPGDRHRDIGFRCAQDVPK
ncbi:MAG: formylglycine-generating enzyme family protein [Nitrospiraceae bacterium]